MYTEPDSIEELDSRVASELEPELGTIVGGLGRLETAGARSIIGDIVISERNIAAENAVSRILSLLPR